MSTYDPSGWTIVKVTPKEGKPHYRIGASWDGSYLYGSSWKLSSGCEGFTHDKENNTYVFPQSSGSTYVCRVGGRSVNAYGHSAIASVSKRFEEQGLGVFEIFSEEERDAFVEQLKESDAVLRG